MYHSSWVTVKKSLEFSGVEKICGSSSTGASFGILRSGNFKALQLWGQWIIFRLRGIFGIGSSAASPSKLYVLNLVCFSCPCFFFPLPDERAELNCYPNYSCIATVFLPSVVSVIGVLWVWESLEEQSFLNIFLLCWMLSAWICFGWIANCHLKGLVWMWWHHFWIKEKLGKDYTFHRVIWISGWTWSLDDCSEQGQNLLIAHATKYLVSLLESLSDSSVFAMTNEFRRSATVFLKSVSRDTML